MTRNQWGCWTALVLAISCNGKLDLESDRDGAGGRDASAGGASAGAPSAGAHSGGTTSHAGTAGTGTPRAGSWNGGSGGDAGDVIEPIDDAAGAGGEGGVPSPGNLHNSCIPSITVKDGSGVAAADVLHLDECALGLACTSDGECERIPDCPRPTGICVLHRAQLGAEASVDDSNFGGAGGGGPATKNHYGVLDMAADESNLYWVEYGTRDALGNYQNDGALMSYSFADHSEHVLGSGLAGPQKVVLTSAHVYVGVDGAQLVGSPVQNKILRLPRTGGTPTVVGEYENDFRATSSGDSLYLNDGAVWKVIDGEGAFSTFLSTGYADNFAADADSLYFGGFGSELMKVPLAGGTPSSVTSPAYQMVLSGSSIYGLEALNGGGGLLLDKVAKSGGTWTRVKSLGQGTPLQFRMVGERYFLINSWGERALLTGTLASQSKLVYLAQLPFDGQTSLAGTSSSVFWSDGRAIYQRPLSDAQ